MMTKIMREFRTFYPNFRSGGLRKKFEGYFGFRRVGMVLSRERGGGSFAKVVAQELPCSANFCFGEICYTAGMYIRKRGVKKNGRKYEYWELVESERTERGPRQRSIAYLGVIEPGARAGMKLAADDQAGHAQGFLFDEPEWVEVDTKRVRVECTRQFGNAWLGLELCRVLGLPDFLRSVMPIGLDGYPLVGDVVGVGDGAVPSM